MDKVHSIELNTIQKRNKLNKVEVWDKAGPDNGRHNYDIINAETGLDILEIQFQEGPRNESTSKIGVLDVDLLEICRHRLQCFQKGPYATRENALALTHIEEALMWLNRRVEERSERGVLGTTKK